MNTFRYLIVAFTCAAGFITLSSVSPFQGKLSSPDVAVTAADETPYSWVRVPDKGVDFDAEVKKHAALALEKKQVPVVFFTAGWCKPCKELKMSMTDQRMKDAFSDTYIIEVDYDIYSDTAMELGYNLGGIPAFFGVDYKGKLTGAYIDGGAWEANIPENMAPVMTDFFREDALPSLSSPQE